MLSTVPSNITIGTRSSKLALTQTNIVKNKILSNRPDITINIRKIKTTGDKITDKTLYEIGGKALFTKEIEEALLAKKIDLAIHSMKDVPTQLPKGLAINCILEREDPRDVLVTRNGATIKTLKNNAVIGTSSLRRAAQLLHQRPDVKIVPLRGNVDTRLNKVHNNTIDGTLLALAGLKRMNISTDCYHILPTPEILPAVAQGAIGIETRENDLALNKLLTKINDQKTYRCIETERAFLSELDGSCHTPIAALCTIENTTINLTGLLASEDGSNVLKTNRKGNVNHRVKLAIDAAQELKSQII